MHKFHGEMIGKIPIVKQPRLVLRRGQDGRDCRILVRNAIGLLVLEAGAQSGLCRLPFLDQVRPKRSACRTIGKAFPGGVVGTSKHCRSGRSPQST
jgi:hypothetical protein